MIGVGWYDAFNDYFALVNGSEMNNMTGQGEMINLHHSHSIPARTGGTCWSKVQVTFAGNASIGDLSTAFDSATWITGEDASLTDMQGVLLLAGHCDAFPTASL